MSEVEKKLTKKERKALEFRKAKEEKDALKEQKEESKKRKRDEETSDKATTKTAEDTAVEGTDGEPKKKRKTRRGKKGKGANGGSGPRFLLFVGNLPFDISQTELVTHFAASSPDRIRIRTEKGIAFLEFDGSGSDIQHKMGVALKMHRSTLRGRKINVELTVGGGGNSQNRLEKIKAKNDKLEDERKEDIKKKKDEKVKKEKEKAKVVPQDLTNVHPARAAAMQRR